MNKEEIIKELPDKLWLLANEIRSTVYGNDLIYGTFRLVFLKYAIDNCLGAESANEVKKYAAAQKALSRRDVEADKTFIFDVLLILDANFELNGIFESGELLREYSKLLQGSDWQKNKAQTSNDSFRKIMDTLSSLDLEEEEDSHEIGRAIVDYFLAEFTKNDLRTKYTGDYSSTSPLAKIAKSILHITSDDCFCDFTSGIGVSTLEITKEKLPATICGDINVHSCGTLAMMLIMYGYESTNVLCKDTLRDSIDLTGVNKIFVDPPVGARVDNKEGKIEAQLIALSMICQHLREENTKDDSIAVIAVPSGTLFQSIGKAFAVRKQIIENRQVSAVISLPPLWVGSSAGTNIIVLTKKKNKEIFFVDATPSKEKEDFYNGNLYSDETLSYLIGTIENRDDINGFSKAVAYTELDKELSLIPSNYVDRIKVARNKTLAEVDAELAELYSMLK